MEANRGGRENSADVLLFILIQLHQAENLYQKCSVI